MAAKEERKPRAELAAGIREPKVLAKSTCRMHGGVDSTVAMRSSPLLREALTQRANVAAKGVRPDPMEEGSVLPFPFHACTTAESHPVRGYGIPPLRHK